MTTTLYHRDCTKTLQHCSHHRVFLRPDIGFSMVTLFSPLNKTIKTHTSETIIWFFAWSCGLGYPLTTWHGIQQQFNQTLHHCSHQMEILRPDIGFSVVALFSHLNKTVKNHAEWGWDIIYCLELWIGISSTYLALCTTMVKPNIIFTWWPKMSCTDPTEKLLNTPIA